MGSDRARRSYDAGRKYRSVVSQQGRVTLEADANEAEEIRTEESRAELIDVIGPSGSPDDGFKISVPTTVPPDLAFSIEAGTYYVGGVRVTTDGTTYYRQALNEWADYVGPEAFPAGTGAFREAIYLALTEQEVGAVEDDALREVALGGPDSAARTRLIQRVQRLTVNGSSCDDAFSSVCAAYATKGLTFDPHTMRVDGGMKLKAGVDATAPTPDPCEPNATKGYLGAENQLIRVKVVDVVVNGQHQTKLLWGYDNASFLYQVAVDTTRTRLALVGTPVDVFHQPRANQWVEVLQQAVKLDGTSSVAADLGEVGWLAAAYEPATKAVTLANAIGGTYTDAYLRVWENCHDFAADETTAIELKTAENVGIGVLVFTRGTSRVIGDYWLIAVRPSTPQKIYPARLQADFQPPDGPRRWIAPLAVIAWRDGRTAADVSDCRHHFKNLVELTEEESGCCELLVRPGDDVQAAIDAQLVANRARNVSGLDLRFAAGTYTFAQPLLLAAPSSGGSISVSGCGPSTELKVRGQEVVMLLSGWTRAHVHDLVVTGGAAGAGARHVLDAVVPGGDADLRHLGGAVTLLDCASSTIERINATCAAGLTRAASCVHVRNQKASPGAHVRVSGCTFVVGQRQVGLLIVNAARATVDDNEVLLGTARLDDPRADASVLRAILEPDIRKLLDLAAKPTTNHDKRVVEGTIKAAMKQLLAGSDRGPLKDKQLLVLEKDLARARKKIVVASGQGIVIGGAIAEDIRITDNSVYGARQGIHVGLSVRGKSRFTDTQPKMRPKPILAGRVQIVGNTVVTVVPVYEKGVHAGIFVGNVEAATVRDNRVSGWPADYHPKDELLKQGDGIRVWGQLGPLVLVSGNVCEHAGAGITVHALPGNYQASRPYQWRVTQNYVEAQPGQGLLLSTGVTNAGDNVA